MEQFKKGDKVKIIKKSADWNSDGEMDKWLGKIMTIKKVFSDCCDMEEDSEDNDGFGWDWDFKCLELIENESSMENITEYQGKKYREVKRVAKVGELVKIVAAEKGEPYSNENVFYTKFARTSTITVGDRGYILHHSEYVVLEPIEQEFTLADLKPCMFVKLRGYEEFCIAIQEKSNIGFYLVNSFRGLSSLSNYDKNFNSCSFSSYDILEVRDFTNGSAILEPGKLLWQRIEKSPVQIELEKLEQEQRELAEKQKRIADKMEEVRKGLK